MSNLPALVLAIVIGVAALWMGFALRRSRRKVAAWAETPGRILERATRTAPAVKQAWQLTVRYTYDVAGRAYEGTRIYEMGDYVIPVSSRRFAKKSGFLQRAVDDDRVKEAFPDRISVRYNPANPADSCLLVQPFWWVWISLGAGVLISLGVLAAVLVWAFPPN